jgi:hypothetical protein
MSDSNKFDAGFFVGRLGDVDVERILTERIRNLSIEGYQHELNLKLMYDQLQEQDEQDPVLVSNYVEAEKVYKNIIDTVEWHEAELDRIFNHEVDNDSS